MARLAEVIVAMTPATRPPTNDAKNIAGKNVKKGADASAWPKARCSQKPRTAPTSPTAWPTHFRARSHNIVPSKFTRILPPFFSKTRPVCN
jgi:hypothetical protein